jgi:hypothetical protein
MDVQFFHGVVVCYCLLDNIILKGKDNDINHDATIGA